MVFHLLALPQSPPLFVYGLTFQFGSSQFRHLLSQTLIPPLGCAPPVPEFTEFGLKSFCERKTALVRTPKSLGSVPELRDNFTGGFQVRPHGSDQPILNRLPALPL